MTKPSKDLVDKKMQGVYRRFSHLIPMQGAGAVQRRRVHTAKTEITEKDDVHQKVPIRTLRRVATQGYEALLYASQRPCCRAECKSCSPGLEDSHEFGECTTSSYTTCKEIQLEPLSWDAPTLHNRGTLALEGKAIGSNATVGEHMAVETESDETPWWLVEVTGLVRPVPNEYDCPDLHCDVEFEYPRHGHGVMVRRLRPATMGRGKDSTRLFEVDTTLPPFLIPTHLIRVGKIQLLNRGAPPARRFTRAALNGGGGGGEGGGGGGGTGIQYELKAETKAKIYERCRCWGDT